MWRAMRLHKATTSSFPFPAGSWMTQRTSPFIGFARRHLSRPRGALFTRAEDEHIIRRRREKVPFDVIAEELGRTTTATDRRFYHYLFKGDVKKEMSVKLPEARFTPEMDAVIHDMLSEGKSYRDIASFLDCSVASISHRWRVVLLYGMSSAKSRSPSKAKSYVETAKRACLEKYRDGLDVPKISAELGISQISVECLLGARAPMFTERPRFLKALWSQEEKDLVVEMRSGKGLTWTEIAGVLRGRSEASIRVQYSRSAAADAARRFRSAERSRQWSPEEDEKLLGLRNVQGMRWSEIVKQLPGRTLAAIKLRYARTRREDMEEAGELEDASAIRQGGT